jgi:hypothetical protein
MSDEKEKTLEMKELERKKEQDVGVANAIGTDTGVKKDEDMAGGNDVKDEFKTVAHVIQQLTDLTKEQAEQLEEMLIDGFIDTNGVTDKTSAYETLVSIINEPKYKEWKDAGEGSLDKYPSLWQDCTRKMMIWKKEQRQAQVELSKKAELRDKTQRGLIVDLSSRLEASGKTLVNNSKTNEDLQLEFDASEASKTALSERVAAMNKEHEKTKIKMEGLQLQLAKYKSHAVVTDDGEAAQSAMSRAEVEGLNEKVLASVNHMMREVYGRMSQVEERQEKLGGDIVEHDTVALEGGSGTDAPLRADHGRGGEPRPRGPPCTPESGSSAPTTRANEAG